MPNNSTRFGMPTRATVSLVGEGIQLGNVIWVFNNIVYAWRSQNEPLCEIRVLPPTRDEGLPVDRSFHE